MNYVQRSEDWIAKAKECAKIQQERKKLEKIEESALEQLKLMSDGVSSCGGGFVFTSDVRKGSVDYSKIEVLKEIDLDSYRKDSVIVWKLTMEVVD